MPRVARTQLGSATTNQNHSPLKIPLNDDRQEKAIRLQSRQALHDIQINQIKAAASPMRKVSENGRARNATPSTPQGAMHGDKENIGHEGMLAVVAGNSMTPMKRMPILANFEEWMKMATDNKINATNSWNFALIDYFHDMSLLKEGDGVNFQKASCTLDGCVKIYTSRVDSVATETGKLLSGLADSAGKKARKDDGDEEMGDDEDGEEDEEGNRKKARRKIQRSSEATLAQSFAQLQLRKFELEFAVDPLFKKASADFDEGGAKGLLLNHLAIDNHGRIVFDSSDDVESPGASNHDEEQDSNPTAKDSSPALETESRDTEGAAMVDENIALLGQKHFPNLDLLEELDICPSLKTFDLGDPINGLELPISKDNKSSISDADNSMPANMDLMSNELEGFEDDTAFVGGIGLSKEAGFGEGGENWAQSAALEPMFPSGNELATNDSETDSAHGAAPFDIHGKTYGTSLSYEQQMGDRESILSYFDKALSKNWAGPEHWRIKRIKDSSRNEAAPASKRKDKEPFEIDFMSPLDPSGAELLQLPASSNSVISLPKAQWKSRTRNLLPDDKHFNSKQLMRLFLKPRARMGSQRGRDRGITSRPAATSNGDLDEAYWARQDAASAENSRLQNPSNYDADFFQDDGLAFADGLPDDDDEFADAREVFSPDLGAGEQGATSLDANSNEAQGQNGTFGSQLVTQSTRLRPEYVQYARVAKKVDVRRLKEEMWKGIGFEEPEVSEQSPGADESLKAGTNADPLYFTEVVNGLQSVYPKQAMADISTSYCFICLLHLANEKSLRIDNEGGLEELMIRQDTCAAILPAAEPYKQLNAHAQLQYDVCQRYRLEGSHVEDGKFFTVRQVCNSSSRKFKGFHSSDTETDLSVNFPRTLSRSAA